MKFLSISNAGDSRSWSKEKNGNHADSGILIVKGAPEGILELSTFYESEGRIAPS